MANAFESPSASSDYTTISSAGTKVGVGKAVKFDGTNVWVYVPDYSSVYKWFPLNRLKKA